MSDTDFQLQNSAQAIEYGRECVKSCIIINGGAAVALVALLSNSAQYDRMFFLTALLAFAVGTALAVLSCAGGYIAQTIFAMSNASGSDRTHNWAIFISFITAAIVISSIGAFGFGVYYAAQAVLHPPEAKLEAPILKLELASSAQGSTTTSL